MTEKKRVKTFNKNDDHDRSDDSNNDEDNDDNDDVDDDSEKDDDDEQSERLGRLICYLPWTGTVQLAHIRIRTCVCAPLWCLHK